MYLDDAEFEMLLTAALHRAAALDYEMMPPDDELDRIVQPSQQFQKRMNALLCDPNNYISKI